MFRRFSINFALLSILFDGIIIVFALAAANHLRPLFNVLPFVTDLFKPTISPILYPVFSIIWILIFLLLSVYDGRKNLHAVDEFSSLTVGSLLATICLAGLLYVTYSDVSRVIFLLFVLIAFTLMLAWRSLFRIWFRFRRFNTVQTRRVLIIGAGPLGRDLETRFDDYSSLGMHIVGFLDDDLGKRASEIDILGNIKDVRKVILLSEVNDVVITLPQRAYEKVNWLVSTLHDLPVKVWVIPDYFHLALHKAIFEEFAGLPMLDLRAPALTDYQRLVKRGFDIVLTIFLLPLSLVIMLLIGIAILLERSGPVFFIQKRVGENGRLFNIYKFRTMVPGAEKMRHMVESVNEEGVLIHKSGQDPRVTRLGRFLRKTSLDELPQLFNILKGDMSLVGPRPEMPYLVELYEPWQRKRFAVPQGITGWWQVNGRSDRPMHLNTEDDLYYVQNYSLLLDLRILLKTVLVVLRGRGAF